jgi:pimeloyl-ACP methyl ester carboxylesterase
VESAIRNAILTIEQGNFIAYLESAYPAYFSPAHAQDTDLKRCFMDMAVEIGPASALLQMKALLALKEPVRHLGSISCSTIIIGGSEDCRTTPAAHQVLAQEIPRSSLLLIEGAAHFTPLEQPGQVTAAFERWLGLEIAS